MPGRLDRRLIREKKLPNVTRTASLLVGDLVLAYGSIAVQLSPSSPCGERSGSLVERKLGHGITVLSPLHLVMWPRSATRRSANSNVVRATETRGRSPH